MGIVVQKYGGSSLGTTERIKSVAERVIGTKDAGKSVVVVVSALGDTTDELLQKAREINPLPPDREMDMLLATGEQISGALLAMAIQATGRDAISLTGSQCRILTDASHTKARIMDIDAARIEDELDKGRVVVVAGFQGVTADNDITTLGRGGSDTTAVALAARLGAEVCEIYTDVDGVYTADPRLVPEARRLDVVSYEEMLEMASTGAKVLQLRSVEYARNYGVLVHVRSSFEDNPGTLVKEVDIPMEERPIISGITHDVAEGKMTVFGVPDRPGVAARLFTALAHAGINIDLIVQNVSREGYTDISFTLAKDDVARAKPVLREAVADLGAKGYDYDAEIAKVSLIGAGMKTHPGVAAAMFSALARNGVNIEMISTSPIKVACVIRAEDVQKAVKALHDEFKLAMEVSRAET